MSEKRRAAKVSVIVPIYNAEKYLSETLDSLVCQVYEDVEIVLIDDGSTDASLDIIKKYKKDNANIVYKTQKNQGVSAARNAGIRLAKGEYVAFCDADDVVSADYLSYMVENMPNDTTAMVWTNATRSFDVFHSLAKHTNHTEVLDRDSGLLRLFNGTMPGVNCASKLIPRQFLIDSDIFFREDMAIGEDFDFCVRCLKESRCVVVSDDIMYYYRVHNESVMQSSVKPVHFKAIDNTSKEGRALQDSVPGLESAVDGHILLGAIFYLSKSHRQRSKFIKERQRLEDLVRRYRWSVLFAKDTRRNLRIKAGLYCISIRLANHILGGVLK